MNDMEPARLTITALADYLRIPHEEALAMAREGTFPPRPVVWGGNVIFSRAFRESMLDQIAKEDAHGDSDQREG
jgi:hypothetical protein